jgi:hypothetical protein
MSCHATRRRKNQRRVASRDMRSLSGIYTQAKECCFPLSHLHLSHLYCFSVASLLLLSTHLFYHFSTWLLLSTMSLPPTQDNLSQGINGVSSQVSHECPYCSLNVNSKEILNDHMRESHSFHCPHATCDRVYASIQQLDKHEGDQHCPEMEVQYKGLFLIAAGSHH